MTAREIPQHVLEGPPPDTEVALLRVPPHSTSSESSVLCGLLLDNAAWDRVGDLLIDADFYRHEHKLIFGAIGALVSVCKPADVITVFEHLEHLGIAEQAGGLPYLNALAQYVVSAGNIRRYAEIVREHSILRQLISTSDEIASAAFNPGGRSVESLLSDAVQKMMGIDTAAKDDDWESIGDGQMRLIDRIQGEADGSIKPDIIPTGLAELDERLDGGGRPGEVIVIGARPGMGKSALGLTIGVNTASRGEPTGYWSGEMSKAQLNTRAMSMRSCIHLSRLKRAERLRDFDWPNITKGVDQLARLPLYFNDKPALTVARLRSQARALKRKRGLRVFVVDHLGIMDPTDVKATRSQQIGEITRGLKQMARELGVLVILLVQLNRDIEKRTDGTPMLSDLRDSGEIEQDADIVVFLHRPFKTKPDLGDEWKYYAKLTIAKLRDGEPGDVHVQYVGENTRFDNWPVDIPIPTNAVRTKRDPTPPL